MFCLLWCILVQSRGARQVNLPWFRETEQKFKMCCSVPWLRQSGHVDTFRFPHLLRLSGEGSELVALRSAKDKTPLGTFLTTDCHITFSSSSTKSWVNSPCIVRLFTFSFQCCKVCSWIVLFTAFFAFGISVRLESSTLWVFKAVGTRNLPLLRFSSKTSSLSHTVECFRVQDRSLSNLESRVALTI